MYDYDDEPIDDDNWGDQWRTEEIYDWARLGIIIIAIVLVVWLFK